MIQFVFTAPWVPVNRITSLGSECPPAGERSLKLKIKDPKNPLNNRCHVVKKVAPVMDIKKVQYGQNVNCNHSLVFPPSGVVLMYILKICAVYTCNLPSFNSFFSSQVDSNTISCGEPVEFTPYDFLKGIAQRSQLVSRPELEVAAVFKKSDTDTTVDVLEIEASLRAAITEVIK